MCNTLCNLCGDYFECLVRKLMPNAKSKKPINVDADIVNRFDYIYPEIKGIFINRALTLALQDKKYFEEVFFNKLFVEVK